MRETFVDEATIDSRSGNGGAGRVAFRREKFVPKGGPNGGDGGRGGDVIVEANSGKRTLLHLRYHRRQFAENGGAGGSSQCTGADGKSCVITVPVGTQIFDADDGTLLADLPKEGSRAVLMVGGRGGKGNEHFKSATRQAPSFAQPGEAGRVRRLRLELKLLADVGLLGMPNVGKSFLISKISAARPKVANYPFTTLVPNLGVVAHNDAEPFVMADVPGLVPNAHLGAGLGMRFLRHVERVRLLVHIVTAGTGIDERSPVGDANAIEHELRQHSVALAERPQVLVLNQCDRPEVAEHREEMAAYAASRSIAFFAISAASGEGVPALLAHLVGRLAKMPVPSAEYAAPPLMPCAENQSDADVAASDAAAVDAAPAEA